MAHKFFSHATIERNVMLLLVLALITVSIGGIVEVVPLFTIETTVEHVKGVRPYSPLELAGRNIYIREGCYLCHSQQIRSLRDEVERYGHWSLAAESMYDHPFQWGSKRTGPDIARIGGKYSDDWHRDHLRNPRSVVPASIMPGYPFLEQTPLNAKHISEDMKVLVIEGVPYTPEMIAAADSDVKTQGSADDAATKAFVTRYPKAISRDLGGNAGKLTEADALIAYLQLLGTQVDFKLYDDKANIR
jgi:cytochrome c oxidase cbb3-type subunit 2